MHPAVANGAYDVARVREDFPALALKVYGKPLVYLDNAASAQKPNAVLDRMTEAYTSEYANVHRGLHYLANAATEAYEGARDQGCRNSSTPAAARRSSSPATPPRRSTSWPLPGAKPTSRPATRSCISIMEHHSNIVPWHFLRERHGAVIKWAPVDDEGNFLIEEFEKLLTPRTKLVAITQMSNALGTIVPVKEVVRAAHARGIPVLVDGSQGAVHLAVDVQDIDCDFYVFTGHKVYGPTGIGVLYAKHEHLVAMRPFNGGGEMIREVAQDGSPMAIRRTNSRPARRRSSRRSGWAPRSTTSIPSARSASPRMSTILLTYAQERLREINSLRLIGTAQEQGPGRSPSR